MLRAALRCASACTALVSIRRCSAAVRVINAGSTAGTAALAAPPATAGGGGAGGPPRGKGGPPGFLVDAHRTPGRGDGLVLGAGRPVQGRGGGQGLRTGLRVLRAGGEVRGQCPVPDLLGRGAAGSGHGRSVAGRAVVRDAVDGLGAAALGQQVEEVVGDAGGVVHVHTAGAARPAVQRRAVLAGLVHVAERADAEGG